MAIFNYTAVDAEGAQRVGTIDAVSIDLAISALQRRGLVISSINPAAEKQAFNAHISFFDRITNADIVMLSRQITSLFEAQVSALRAFRLLAAEARTPKLALCLTEIGNDIQSGSTISAALSKHPQVFSAFYVNMVKAGEESGKLDETFSFLADYMDRNYEITSKARNALIYPAFIMLTFVSVMVLVMTVIIPQLSGMLGEVGQKPPMYTVAVIAISNFFVHFGVLILGLIVVAVLFLLRFIKTPAGADMYAHARLQLPAVGVLLKQLYLSRVADNLGTMLKSGVQILRGLEITAQVVGDPIFERVLTEVAADVKNGFPISDAMRKHPEIPGIMAAMLKIGEETGNMGVILETIAKFYRREVNNTIDTLVGLIEPFLIVTLALGVGILLSAILVPIYNIASSF